MIHHLAVADRSSLQPHLAYCSSYAILMMVTKVSKPSKTVQHLDLAPRNHSSSPSQSLVCKKQFRIECVRAFEVVRLRRLSTPVSLFGVRTNRRQDRALSHDREREIRESPGRVVGAADRNETVEFILCGNSECRQRELTGFTVPFRVRGLPPA